MKNFFLLVSGLSAAVWCVAAEFCGHKMAAKRPHGPCLLWWQRGWFSHLVSRKTVAHSGDSTDTPTLRVLVWMRDQSCHWCPLAWTSARMTTLIQWDRLPCKLRWRDRDICVWQIFPGQRRVSGPACGGRRTKKQGVTAPSPWGHWDWESWCERLEWRSVHSALVWCPAAQRWTERPLPAATQTRASWTRSGRAAGSWACGSWAAWRRSPRSEPCCRRDLAHPGRRRPWRRAEAGWGGVLGSAGLEVGQGEEPVLGLGTTGRGAGACGATWGVDSAGRQRRAPSVVAMEICWIKDGLIKTTERKKNPNKTNRKNRMLSWEMCLYVFCLSFLPLHEYWFPDCNFVVNTWSAMTIKAIIFHSFLF